MKSKRKLPLNTVASFTHCAVRLRVTLNDDVVNFCHIICHVGKWLMLKMQKQLLFFYISTPQEEEIFLTIRVTIVISCSSLLRKESFISCRARGAVQQFW